MLSVSHIKHTAHQLLHFSRLWIISAFSRDLEEGSNVCFDVLKFNIFSRWEELLWVFLAPNMVQLTGEGLLHWRKVFLNEVFNSAASNWKLSLICSQLMLPRSSRFMSGSHLDSYSLCYSIRLTSHVTVRRCEADPPALKLLSVCLHLCFVSLPRSKDLDHMLQRSWITLKPELSSFHSVRCVTDEARQHGSWNSKRRGRFSDRLHVP